MRPTNREMRRRPQIKVGIYGVQEKGAVNFQIGYLHKSSNTDGMAVAKRHLLIKLFWFGIRHFNSDICLFLYHDLISDAVDDSGFTDTPTFSN